MKATTRIPGHVLILGILALIGLGGCDDEYRSGPTAPVPGEHVERLTRNVDAAAAARLSARTTNGTIELTGGGGGQTRVEIVITVRASSTGEAAAFARDIEIETVRDGDEVVIRHIYPQPPDGMQVSVDYEIECPRNLELALATGNGRIASCGSTAAVSARTINGNIDLLAAGGPFDLGVTNGMVIAEIRGLAERGKFAVGNGRLVVHVLDGNASLDLTTVNGAVTLTLPATFGGRLDARNTVGSISCELSLGGQHGHTPHHVWGTIGGGGANAVTLRSVIGSIEIGRL